MTSKEYGYEILYGKVYEILIWYIVMRNRKSTFFKNTIRKSYYSYHKSFKIPFLRTMLEKMWEGL